jgi:hypothetical protein
MNYRYVCIYIIYTATLFIQIYVGVGIWLTYGIHLHNNIITEREEMCAHKSSLTLGTWFLSKGLYQGRKVSGLVFVCFGVSILPL